MKRGKTEAQTISLNGWVVGDVLQGDEGYGPDRIKITCIGEEKFLCRWDYGACGVWSKENGQTTLEAREWEIVDER